jgi:voltage-gated potassium channel
MADARRYQRVAEPVGAGLGLLFLVAYAWPILQPGLPTVAAGICWWCGAVIWVLLAADYAVRLVLAPHRLRFLRRTWLDLLMVVLPMFRPLRALRALLALRALDRLSPRLTRRTVVGNVVITVAPAARWRRWRSSTPSATRRTRRSRTLATRCGGR